MKKFEKIKNKYALNNSYFKNRRPADPSTPFEVLEYVKEYNELPYSQDLHDDWFYDCFIEYQKRAGVQNAQFFTPKNTAFKMVDIAIEHSYASHLSILDACCGFGQITKELVKSFDYITAFDIDSNMIDACDYFCNSKKLKLEVEDFKNPIEKNGMIKGIQGRKYDIVVANPPYEVKDLTDFLYFLYDVMYVNGVAILLIPQSFLDKTRPIRLVNILNKFHILNRTPMTEEFARTKTKAEIVELRKI